MFKTRLLISPNPYNGKYPNFANDAAKSSSSGSKADNFSVISGIKLSEFNSFKDSKYSESASLFRGVFCKTFLN